MKRNVSLKPLSLDHYDGLVVARRLQQGLDKHADPEVMRAYVVNFWDQHLRDHCEQEEAHLLPELRRLRAWRHKWQLTKHHEQISTLIEQLRAPHPSMRTTLSVLSEVMRTHIRYEERELFPFLESYLEPDRLERIGNYLQEDHQDANKEWAPSFWA